MQINMNISHITTLSQISEFLQSNNGDIESPNSKTELYNWLNLLLFKLRYQKLKKQEKRLVKRFIGEITGYSQRQIKRLISKHKNGTLAWKEWKRGGTKRIYSNEDIILLHKTDKEHRLSGPATKKILLREYHVYHKQKYENLAKVSVSHIYNLRNHPSYLRRGKLFHKTSFQNIPIGIRKKPHPNGRPGFMRVDTVHQGDLNKEKGVYFINIIDEVTQTELIFCIPSISDKYMKPVLKFMIGLCPFVIINFHSDNGSEYINYVVANILNRLHIKQTKSRPRKHNDNALVEGKNGSIIRKTFGYYHIPATVYNAKLINDFCVEYLNPYLIFHRPCGFATTITDKRGKQKKVYRHGDYETSYEQFKALIDAKKYLKKGVTFGILDEVAYLKSDTDFAREMNSAKKKMWQKLKFKR